MSHEVIDYKGIKVLKQPYGEGGKIITDNFKYIVDNLGNGISDTEEFFISTAGNDETGDGSEGSPWATLSHAMDELRSLRFKNPVIVNVAPGHYTHGEPINLYHVDGHLITIKGTEDYVRPVEHMGADSAYSNHVITLGLKLDDPAINIVAGDYALLKDIEDSIPPATIVSYGSERFVGCHRISSVVPLQQEIYIRVKILGAISYTAYNPPWNAIEDGTVRILKSVLVFSSSDALVLSNGNINLENLAITTTDVETVPGPNTKFMYDSLVKMKSVGFYNALTCSASKMIAEDCGFSEGFTLEKGGQAHLDNCSQNGTYGIRLSGKSELFTESCMFASGAYDYVEETALPAITIDSGSYGQFENSDMSLGTTTVYPIGLAIDRGSSCFVDGGEWISRYYEVLVSHSNGNVIIDNATIATLLSPAVVTGTWNSVLTISNTTIGGEDNSVGIKATNSTKIFLYDVNFEGATSDTDPVLSVDDGSEIRHETT